MVSQISICEKALSKIGAGSLMNINTDESPQSIMCGVVYDDLLLEILREYDWSFAIFRQSLNRDTSTPAYQYAYRYILPTVPQMVKLIEVEDNTDFALENNFLVTNASSVNIKFVGKETDPNKYDSMFVDAFATRIAAEVCYKITSDKVLTQKMEQEYLFKLSSAKEKNYQEVNLTVISGGRFNESRQSFFNSNISQLVE